MAQAAGTAKMAQAARQQVATVSRIPPAAYKGTPGSWRVLTEAIWPGAKSADSIMLALSYCASRGLDPMKRPVHIVPVYNSVLKREVETVWPGISELLTVASRSKQFAGVDEPRDGPIETRTFQSTYQDRDGNTVTNAKTVSFPLWSSVTVYRLVQGVRFAFSQPVYWLEAYARQGFRSEVPNDMWSKRPRGQCHKCALAASLRLAFPEDIGGDYSAEEMEGREVGSGGVIIDHEAEDQNDIATAFRARGDALKAAHEAGREAEHEVAETLAKTPDPPPVSTVRHDADGTTHDADDHGGTPHDDDPDPLDELNGTIWLKNLDGVLHRAASEADVVEIAGHPRLRASLDTAPTLIVERINTMLREAHERVRPPIEIEEEPEFPDPIADLRIEVEVMDLATIDDLRNSSAWKEKTKHLIPPDWDLLEEAIAARRATLVQETTDHEHQTQA
jgi:phage recombination protein Bet